MTDSRRKSPHACLKTGGVSALNGLSSMADIVDSPGPFQNHADSTTGLVYNEG